MEKSPKTAFLYLGNRKFEFFPCEFNITETQVLALQRINIDF